MIEEKREKIISKRDDNYTGKCPKCKEQGKTPVLPFGDDYYFCENADCPVTRHSNIGYSEFTNESIHAPNVNIAKPESYLKRHKIKKSI